MIIKINKTGIYFFTLIAFVMSTFFQTTSGFHIRAGFAAIIVGVLVMMSDTIKLNYNIIMVWSLNILFVIGCLMPRDNFSVDLYYFSIRNIIISLFCITGNFLIAAYLMRYVDRKYITMLFYLTFLISVIRVLTSYSSDALIEGIRGKVRLGNEIYDINAMGMFFSILALFFIFRVVSDSKYKRLEMIFCAVCVVLGLTSGSRKAFLIFLIGVVGIFFRNNGFKFNKYLTMGVTAIVIFIIIGCFQGGDAIASLFSSIINVFTGKEKSISDITRRGMIKYGLQNWTEYPLAGHGMNMYGVLSPYKVYAHNNYIEILFDYGMIGLILFYLPRIIVMVATAKYAGKHRDDEYAWFMFVILFTLLLSDVACVSYISDIQFPFWLACAFLDKGEEEKLKGYSNG